MLKILEKFNQIFLLGITGSGKTFFAKELSENLNKEYYNFDMNWDYDLKIKNPVNFLNKIQSKNNLIVDGIPYFEDGTYMENIFVDFINYANKNNVGIICIFFEDIKKWIKYIILKEYYNVDTFSKFNGNYFITHWYECYEKTINIFISKCESNSLFFYNKDTGFVNKEQFILKKKRIKKSIEILKDKNLLRVYLDMLKQEPDYDAYYQDIECINFIGYSKSYETWEKIKEFNFKNKIIFDIGCFHGYFTFKISDSGCANFVYGVDISNRVLETCNILSNIYKRKNIEFFQWNENNEILNNVNLVLCLNVLHHFKEQEKFLQNIKMGTEFIFEVEDNQKSMIEKHFKIEKILKSHRENRIIIQGFKK